jgi:hypothetical protein
MEGKTYEKEPIFPDVKEISLGEALFSGDEFYIR